MGVFDVEIQPRAGPHPAVPEPQVGFCSILGILSLQRSLLSSRTYARSLAAIGGFGASALSAPAVEEPTSNGKNRGRNRRKRGRRASETPSPTWFFAKEKTLTS